MKDFCNILFSIVSICNCLCCPVGQGRQYCKGMLEKDFSLKWMKPEI